MLKLYVGLRSYFLSESCSQQRFTRLQHLFGAPITEVYLLFFQPVFTQFLQREDPCIHLVHDCCDNLLRKVLGKFVKLDVIKSTTTFSEVNTGISNQLSDDNIFIGFLTIQTLQKLERGDCSPSDSRKFLRQQ